MGRTGARTGDILHDIGTLINWATSSFKTNNTFWRVPIAVMLVKMSQYGYRTVVLRLKWIPSWKFTHCDFHLILLSSSNILLPKFKWEKSCRHCTTLSGYFDRWNIRQREQWSHNSAVDPTRGYEGRSSARCSRGNWFPRLLARPFVIWRKSRERWLINSDTAGDTCERSERVCA